MRMFIYFLMIIITFVYSSSPATLKCDFNFGGLHLVGNIYRCIVLTSPNIYSEEAAQIKSIDGSHKDNKSNVDVGDFFIRTQSVSYFPRDLDQYFPNLVTITVDSCSLLEIHQEDLKGFSNLVAFQIQDNSIEVIEEGLFDYNPKLKKISIYEKNLIHIDPNVFDNLPKLGYLWLSLFKCTNAHVTNSRQKVKEAIKVVKEKCVNSEFVKLEKQIRKLENESKVLSYDDFEEKFVDFEMSSSTSRFLKFSPIWNIYKQLKDLNDNEPTTPVSIISDLKTEKSVETTPKVQHIEHPTEQLLSNISSSFEDLKSSQCGLKDVLNDVKSSQDNLARLFSELSISQDEVGTTLGDTKSSVNNIEDNFQNFEKWLKDSQDTVTNSLAAIDTKIVGLESQNNVLKSELADVKTKLQGLKEITEQRFDEFDAKNEENFGKIKKELTNIRHKIEISFDEKIGKIEKRLLSKFEEILDEKLAKILVEKLENVLGPKLSK